MKRPDRRSLAGLQRELRYYADPDDPWAAKAMRALRRLAAIGLDRWLEEEMARGPLEDPPGWAEFIRAWHRERAEDETPF